MASNRSSISRVLDDVKKTAMDLGASAIERTLKGSDGPQLQVRLSFDFSAGRADLMDPSDRLLLTATLSSKDVPAWQSELGYLMDDGDFAGAYFSRYTTFNTDIASLEHASPAELRAVSLDAKEFTERLLDATQTPLQLLQLIEGDKAWRQEFFRMTAFRALVVGPKRAVEVAMGEIARLKSVKIGRSRNLTELETYIARILASIDR